MDDNVSRYSSRTADDEKMEGPVLVSSDAYAVALFFSSFLFLIKPQTATLCICIYLIYNKSRRGSTQSRPLTLTLDHLQPPLLYQPPLFLLFIARLTTFRAALVYTAYVCALKQHKHPDTSCVTAMSIELQSSLFQASTRTRWWTDGLFSRVISRYGTPPGSWRPIIAILFQLTILVCY